ncbi:MAG: hypothetical protein AAGK26_10905 [Pseudomonadota bacterium]
MADTTHSQIHVPFGAGAVVADTFSVFFKKIHVVILLGFIPALFEVIVNSYALNQSAETLPGTDFVSSAFTFTTAIATLVTLVVSSVTTAMVIQLAYDAKLGRSVQIAAYFLAAVRNLPAIVVLSVVASILYMFGMLLLIIPGVWLFAVFSVLVPAIVIDGAGFRALQRSAQLTKDYRWPIVGTLILVFFCIFLVMIVFGFILAALLGLFSDTGTSTSSIGLWMIPETVISAIGYGWSGFAIAMIFARLKEIKEGVSVSDLVDVFK